jgi:uncharacterized protein
MLLIIAAELVAFIAIMVADARGWVPLTQTIALLPMVALVMWLQGEPWAQIGWRPPDHWGRAIAIGIAAGIAMELLAVWVTTPMISRALGTEPDYSGLRGIRGNLKMLLIFLALSWTLAAFGEEICFRGFLMERLARLFGGSNAAWIASLLLSSVVFGLGHTEQGPAGWLQEGLSGLLLGILFLASGGNLVVPIVAHGVSNTLAFVLIYFDRYPGLR